MNISIKSENKERKCIPSLIPERSKAVETAWLKAKELSKSDQFCKAHFVAAAYAAKAVAISFFNSLAYLGLAIYHFATKTLIHCDGKQGAQDFKDAAKSLALCLIGVGVVAAVFFAPKAVFNQNEKPLPKALPDKTSDKNPPTELKDDEKSISQEKAPESPKSPSLDFEQEQSLNTNEGADKFRLMLDDMRKKSVTLRVPPARGTEHCCHFSDSFSANYRSMPSASPNEGIIPSTMTLARPQRCSIFDELLFADPTPQRAAVASENNSEVAADSSNRAVDTTQEPQSLQNQGMPAASAMHFAPQTTSNDRSGHTGNISVVNSGNSQGNNPTAKKVEDSEVVKRVSFAPTPNLTPPKAEPGQTFDSTKLARSIWSKIESFLGVDDKANLLGMIRAGGSASAVTRAMKPAMLKEYFKQNGIDLRILEETNENGIRRYHVMIILTNIKSQNVIKPTRNDTNERMAKILKSIQRDFDLLKAKGLIDKKSEIVIRSLDCSYSDISLRSIFSKEAKVLANLKELDISSTRLTYEAFEHLHSLPKLETFTMNFCHGVGKEFDRYERRDAGTKKEKDQFVIMQIHGATKCPSVKTVNMIGTVLHGHWVEAISSLFPNVETIYYTANIDGKNENGNYRLDCGHVVDFAKAEMAVNNTHKCPQCSQAVASKKLIHVVAHRIKQKDGSWGKELMIEHGAMVHDNCGTQFNPSDIEKLFNLGEQAKAAKAKKAGENKSAAPADSNKDKDEDFNPLKAAIKAGYCCPRCNERFTEKNMLPIKL